MARKGPEVDKNQGGIPVPCYEVLHLVWQRIAHACVPEEASRKRKLTVLGEEGPRHELDVEGIKEIVHVTDCRKPVPTASCVVGLEEVSASRDERTCEARIDRERRKAGEFAGEMARKVSAVSHEQVRLRVSDQFEEAWRSAFGFPFRKDVDFGGVGDVAVRCESTGYRLHRRFI